MHLSPCYTLNPANCEIPSLNYTLFQNECPSLTSATHAYFMTNCPQALEEYLKNAEYLLSSGYQSSLSIERLSYLNKRYKEHSVSIDSFQEKADNHYVKTLNRIKNHLRAEILDLADQRHLSLNEIDHKFNQELQRYFNQPLKTLSPMTYFENREALVQFFLEHPIMKEFPEIIVRLLIVLKLSALHEASMRFTEVGSFETSHFWTTLIQKALPLTAVLGLCLSARNFRWIQAPF